LPVNSVSPPISQFSGNSLLEKSNVSVLSFSWKTSSVSFEDSSTAAYIVFGSSEVEVSSAIVILVSGISGVMPSSAKTTLKLDANNPMVMMSVKTIFFFIFFFRFLFFILFFI